MMFRKTMTLTLVGMMGLMSTAAMAVKQGVPGKTSAAELNVGYDSGSMVRIWGIKDVSLSAQKLRDSYDFCTSNNNSPSIMFTLNSANNFKLVNAGDANVSIDYKVRALNSGGAGAQAWWGIGSNGNGVTDKATFGSQTNMAAGVSACESAHKTSHLSVEIPALPENLSDGAYTDVLTLMISPK